MCGVKFERCAGLVENKVRFSNKQLMESDMEEELVAALREAECIYDENKNSVWYVTYRTMKPYNLNDHKVNSIGTYYCE